jgi:hypothetical protein
VMAHQTRHAGGRDAHVLADMQLDALTAALPEGTVSDLVLHPRGTVLSLLDGELEVRSREGLRGMMWAEREGTVSDLVLHPRGMVLSLLDGELEVRSREGLRGRLWAEREGTVSDLVLAVYLECPKTNFSSLPKAAYPSQTLGVSQRKILNSAFLDREVLRCT